MLDDLRRDLDRSTTHAFEIGRVVINAEGHIRSRKRMRQDTVTSPIILYTNAMRPVAFENYWT